MKSKIINICMLLTSLCGYLEWGKGNRMFLIQGEVEVVSKLISNPASVINPFTLIPLFGQIILIATLFQKKPSTALSITGLICLSVLLLFIFAIGIMGLNMKIFVSTIPFLVSGIVAIRHYRKKKVDAGKGNTI